MKKVSLVLLGLLFAASACSDDDGIGNKDKVISDYCHHEAQCTTKYGEDGGELTCYSYQTSTFSDLDYNYPRCRGAVRDAFLHELKNMSEASCEDLLDFHNGILPADTFQDMKYEKRRVKCLNENYVGWHQ